MKLRFSTSNLGTSAYIMCILSRRKNTITIHCLHDFAHKLNSLVLITVWRVVIEVRQDSQLNSSAFSHCSVWRVAIGKGV